MVANSPSPPGTGPGPGPVVMDPLPLSSEVPGVDVPSGPGPVDMGLNIDINQARGPNEMGRFALLLAVLVVVVTVWREGKFKL